MFSFHDTLSNSPDIQAHQVCTGAAKRAKRNFLFGGFRVFISLLVRDGKFYRRATKEEVKINMCGMFVDAVRGAMSALGQG